MILSKEEKAMVAGKYGPGMQSCISFLIKYGEAFGADRLVGVASAHVYNAFPLDLLEKMTEGVDRAGTFTTIHPFMSLCDPTAYEKMGVVGEQCAKQNDDHLKRKEIYDRLGFFQTYTCVPMLVGNFPIKGDYVSWFGSSTQLFVNSIIGARQNRDGAVVNMAIAVTGRAPNCGLFLDENRKAEVLIDLKDLDTTSLTASEFSAIGYEIGSFAQDKNVAVNGLSRSIGLDKLKYLLHPISTSGAVSICHLVGITTEAPDLDAALGNRAPKKKMDMGLEELAKAKAKFQFEKGTHVDLVILGCPHCSIQELREIAGILKNSRIGSNQRLWVGTAHQLYDLAVTMGYAETIENANGVFSRACMATIPDCAIPADVQTVATNSFKTAHYISAISKGRIRVAVGEIESCITAAIRGAWEGGS